MVPATSTFSWFKGSNGPQDHLGLTYLVYDGRFAGGPFTGSRPHHLAGGDGISAQGPDLNRRAHTLARGSNDGAAYAATLSVKYRYNFWHEATRVVS